MRALAQYSESSGAAMNLHGSRCHVPPATIELAHPCINKMENESFAAHRLCLCLKPSTENSYGPVEGRDAGAETRKEITALAAEPRPYRPLALEARSAKIIEPRASRHSRFSPFRRMSGARDKRIKTQAEAAPGQRQRTGKLLTR